MSLFARYRAVGVRESPGSVHIHIPMNPDYNKSRQSDSMEAQATVIQERAAFQAAPPKFGTQTACQSLSRKRQNE